MSENTNVFHDNSWATPWRSSEFPPEESALERRRRFGKKPSWDNNAWNDWIPRFFRFQATMNGAWPWGYVIYRTSFTATSDEDFAAAIEKLDRYCYSKMPLDKDRKHFWCQPNIHEVVREGYRNVIVQDPSLEGASTDVIRQRHIQWLEGRGFHLYLGIPRFDYCLFLDDRAVRSILASSEPDNKSGLVGYVNLIDCDFVPGDPDNDSSEHYDGSLRIWLIDLFGFALCCENLTTGEQQWGDWGMERPGRVVFTDGYASLVEEQDIFLCPSDYSITSYCLYPGLCRGKRNPVTESQYNELRRSTTQDSRAN
ncbi:hypothetical protein PoHVEF18_004624 [Penicillium ochrochloron]